MEALDILIKIGAVAAALSATIAFIYTIVKIGRAIYNFIHKLDKNVSKLLRHDDAQYLAILRLTVTADHMPISERLIAGKEYIDRGGNGEVKKMYLELKRQCEESIEE